MRKKITSCVSGCVFSVDAHFVGFGEGIPRTPAWSGPGLIPARGLSGRTNSRALVILTGRVKDVAPTAVPNLSLFPLHLSCIVTRPAYLSFIYSPNTPRRALEVDSIDGTGF